MPGGGQEPAGAGERSAGLVESSAQAYGLHGHGGAQNGAVIGGPSSYPAGSALSRAHSQAGERRMFRLQSPYDKVQIKIGPDVSIFSKPNHNLLTLIFDTELLGQEQREPAEVAGGEQLRQGHQAALRDGLPWQVVQA